MMAAGDAQTDPAGREGLGDLGLFTKDRWRIVDPWTYTPITVASYLTRASAEAQVEMWKRRAAAGGRPDLDPAVLDRVIFVNAAASRLTERV